MKKVYIIGSFMADSDICKKVMELQKTNEVIVTDSADNIPEDFDGTIFEIKDEEPPSSIGKGGYLGISNLISMSAMMMPEPYMINNYPNTYDEVYDHTTKIYDMTKKSKHKGRMLRPSKFTANRNDTCPCGSNIKYKHCCINKTAHEYS